MLELAAQLDGEGGIPTKLFSDDNVYTWVIQNRRTKWSPGSNSGSGRPFNADVVATEDLPQGSVERGLHCLRRLSLVTVDTDLVRVHTVVQAITRDRNSDRVNLAGTHAANALLSIWPDIDTAAGLTLRSNAAALIGHASSSTPPHAIRDRFGRSCGDSGDALGAVTAFRLLLSDMMCVHSIDHPDTLTTRSNLAHWIGATGNVAAAAVEFDQLLSDMIRVHGTDHPATLTTRSNLAHSLGMAGDVVGAATVSRQVLTDRLRTLGSDHPQTLATRANLAHWLGESGKLAEAVTALNQALTDMDRILGSNHPTTLASRGELAR